VRALQRALQRRGKHPHHLRACLLRRCAATNSMRENGNRMCHVSPRDISSEDEGMEMDMDISLVCHCVWGGHQPLSTAYVCDSSATRDCRPHSRDPNHTLLNSSKHSCSKARRRMHVTISRIRSSSSSSLLVRSSSAVYPPLAPCIAKTHPVSMRLCMLQQQHHTSTLPLKPHGPARLRIQEHRKSCSPFHRVNRTS
jgi:hypothetical protein